MINHGGVNLFAYPVNEGLPRPFTQTGEASEERRRTDLSGTQLDADCGSSVFKSRFLVHTKSSLDHIHVGFQDCDVGSEQR